MVFFNEQKINIEIIKLYFFSQNNNYTHRNMKQYINIAYV